MGLFKGSIASLVSGKVGGLVFQKNGRVRPYRMPTNPRTTLQDIVRNAFIAASGLWPPLDANVQAAWSTWGTAHPQVNRIGDFVPITGKQAIIGLNVPRLQAGMTAISTVPGPDPLNTTVPANQPTLAITALTDVIDVSGFSLDLGSIMTVYVGAPRSPSSVRGRKALVYTGKLTGAIAPITTGSIFLTSGLATAGNVYDCKVVIRSTTAFNYEQFLITVTAA